MTTVLYSAACFISTALQSTVAHFHQKSCKQCQILHLWFELVADRLRAAKRKRQLALQRRTIHFIVSRHRTIDVQTYHEAEAASVMFQCKDTAV